MRRRVAAADGDEPVALMIRLGAVAVVLWNLGQIGRTFAFIALSDTRSTLWWEVGALAPALPADGVLLVAAMRNVRPRLTGWLLAAVTLPVIALAPFGPYDWAVMLAMPAALALIYFRPPVNFAACALVIGLVPVSVAWLGAHPNASTAGVSGWERIQYDSFDGVDDLWVAIALAVLVWLIRAVRELNAARRHLADQAVIVERQRIDNEVASTLGAALEQIVARGEAALALAETASGQCAAELSALTAQSRDTLARARAAVGLPGRVGRGRAAGGGDAAVSGRHPGRPGVRLDQDAPAELPEIARTGLRETIARALEDRSLRECVLVADDRDGELIIRLSQPAGSARCEEAA